MRPFATLTHAGQVRRLRRAAQAVLPRFGLPTAPLRLVGVSENAVFELRAPGQGRFAVRVHRTGYHDRAAIESELAWMAALGDALGDRVPRARPTTDGAWCATTPAEGLDEARQVSVLPWLVGRAQGARLGAGWARAVGELTGHLHAHAQRWTPPAGFQRPVWDGPGMLSGSEVTWQPPESLPGLRPAERSGLAALRFDLLETLAAWPRGPADVGLIHADLHGHNVLTQGGVARAIDFDDAGFGWWWADLVVGLRPGPRRADVAPKVRAWAQGYRAVAPLPAAGLERLPVLWAVRRLLVCGWFAAEGQAALRAKYIDLVLADLRWLLREWPRGTYHRQAEAGLRGLCDLA